MKLMSVEVKPLPMFFQIVRNISSHIHVVGDTWVVMYYHFWSNQKPLLAFSLERQKKKSGSEWRSGGKYSKVGRYLVGILFTSIK